MVEMFRRSFDVRGTRGGFTMIVAVVRANLEACSIYYYGGIFDY
jgi:hypothetical protein